MKLIMRLFLWILTLSLSFNSYAKTVPPKPIKPVHFHAFGKVGFSDGNKGGNASIQWQQDGDSYNIRLYGPLGSGSVQIKGTPKKIYAIQSDGKTVHANTPEELVKKAFGWEIPVSGLRYWLRGLPAPGKAPAKVSRNAKGQVTELFQEGWQVNYLSYSSKNGLETPTKLILKNHKIRLKFMWSRWKIY